MTPKIAQAVLDAMNSSVSAEPGLINCGWIIEHIPKGAILKMPSSATAFANRRPVRHQDPSKPHGDTDRFSQCIETVVYIIYTDPLLDEAAQVAINSWADAMIAAAGDLSSQFQLGYANYNPTPRSADAETVFKENYARLGEVKRKYDPMKVFDKWFLIEPAGREA